MTQETDILEEFAEKLKERMYLRWTSRMPKIIEDDLFKIINQAVAELRKTYEDEKRRCSRKDFTDGMNVAFALRGKE